MGPWVLINARWYKLAAASLLAKHWLEGYRHDAALALSGALLGMGWSVDQSKEFIEAICKAADDGEPQDRLKAVETTQTKQDRAEPITGFPKLSVIFGDEVIEKVCKWWAPGRGDNLIVDAAMELPPRPHAAFERTELGNADLFCKEHGDDCLFCFGVGNWFVWDGMRWAEDRKGEVLRKFDTTIRRLFKGVSGVADSREREALSKWAVQSATKNKLKSMTEIAQKWLRTTSDELDQAPWLLNCENGTIDLRVGDLKPHRRNDRITKLVPVEYDANAKCPIFEEFLLRITDENAELISFLRRAVGYSLTGSTREQCLFVAFGSGANGKSTLLSILGELLDDYALHTPVQTLMQKKFDGGVSNDLARLRGARFVTATEGEANQRLAESLIKQLTGGDKITARFLNKEFFEFDPIAKIWLATNHKPGLSGDDDAIWRRIYLIPFDVTIPKEEQDHELARKLQGELPGILAWAVRGCLEWQAKGLDAPAIVRAATEDYRREMDFVRQFAEDAVVEKKGSRVEKKVMHTAFATWIAENGGEPLTKAELTRRLKHVGFADGRIGQGRYWKGVALRDDLTEARRVRQLGQDAIAEFDLDGLDEEVA